MRRWFQLLVSVSILFSSSVSYSYKFSYEDFSHYLQAFDPLIKCVTFGALMKHMDNNYIGNRWPVVALVSSGLSVWAEAEMLDQKKNNKSSPQQELVIPEFNKFEFVQFKSIRQREDNCGWFALANALAIQRVMLSAKPVNEHVVALEFESIWNELILPKQQELLKIIGENEIGATYPVQRRLLANEIGLKNSYSVSLKAGQCVFYPVDKYADLQHHLAYEYQDKIFRVGNISSFFKTLFAKHRNPALPYVHILLATDADPLELEGHVVLLSIVARKNQKPLVIYMDSNNYPLADISIKYGVPFFVLKTLKLLDTPE